MEGSSERPEPKQSGKAWGAVRRVAQVALYAVVTVVVGEGVEGLLALTSGEGTSRE
jgi:hypothetical protein